jgi:anti-sigma-K factor RskA
MSDTRPQGPPDEAMLDLLIKQVTEGLSPAEQRALDVLDSEVASSYSRDLERAAAALALAAKQDDQPLPPALTTRLVQQADEHFAASRKIVDLSEVRGAEEQTSARTTRRSGTYGWLAAAACLVLAVFGWLRLPEKPVPTPAQERAALLAQPNTLKITLGATQDPSAAGVTGDVVWDPATQRGFLHFAGLAANDPAVRQYQIWIFDATRDQHYPVSGGVFDVPANSAEVVIPIRAALMIAKPAAFAVTVEKPGGVMVSGLEHVVALGKTG